MHRVNRASHRRKLAAMLGSGALLLLTVAPAMAWGGHAASAASVRSALLQAESVAADSDELDELDQLDGADAPDAPEATDAPDAGDQGDASAGDSQDSADAGSF